MDAPQVEKLTVEAFVVSERRERWLADLARPMLKRRSTVRLYDTRDFDQRWLTPLSREQHTATAVVALLRGRESPEDVWLMEAHEVARPWRLDEAVAEAIRANEGLVICQPGTLAYLETETDGGFILGRQGAPSAR